MSAQSEETPSYEVILGRVRTWPMARRLTLVQDILATLTPEDRPEPQRSSVLSRAVGLLATGDPPPSDSEIANWLDQRRQERYGL
jgi:hypothetical protein